MKVFRTIASGLALSLAITAAAGCSASHDAAATTNDDNAYTEDATVRFTTESWSPAWSGSVRAGGNLRVAYDFARLPQCRNQGRVVSWVIEVSWRFDGGEVKTAALDGSPGASDVLPESGIVIPRGAKQIELWFENRAVGGYDDCTAWDSNYAANYVHAIAD